MSFRPTKITKFFPVESSSDPLHFFPKTNTKEKIQQEVVIREPPLASTLSSFDHFTIALVTQHTTSRTSYSIYFTNSTKHSIVSKIENIENQVIGDLNALLECLKYLVYHPSFYQKINKQRIVIYTNSPTITSILRPNSTILSSNLYFKIQGLLKCIKNVYFELQNIDQSPCLEALSLLSTNQN